MIILKVFFFSKHSLANGTFLSYCRAIKTEKKNYNNRLKLRLGFSVSSRKTLAWADKNIGVPMLGLSHVVVIPSGPAAIDLEKKIKNDP